MSSTKEIKNHISSVKDTKKITNAMYLIASTKMRKAKCELDLTRPYFSALKNEIKRIFRISENIDNNYFYPAQGEPELKGNSAYLVITADKGLAGAYNQNVIKEAMKLMKEHNPEGYDSCKIFVVGEYGRHFFASHNIPIEQSFLYTAQNPTLHRAREITTKLLGLYDCDKIDKIYIVYTDFAGGFNEKACSARLLPFHRADFITDTVEKAVTRPFEFYPSIETVLDNIVPSYISGYIYSALIDSFCSEQNARMTAMDSANQNAQKLLSDLSVEYNHVRQSAITQEITEISSGAKALSRKNLK